MRGAVLLHLKLGTVSSISLHPHSVWRRQPLQSYRSHSRRIMSPSKLEAGTNGGNAKESSSESKAGRNFVLALFAGIYAALTGCLAKAAVSMEGNLDRRLDIDRQLRRYEKTSKACPKSGVVRYDFAHVASNDPAEDEHQEFQLPVPSGYWSFFGLYDGHNGGKTSKWLASNMIPAVSGALADLYSRLVSSDPAPSEDQTIPLPHFSDVEQVFKTTFAQLDDDMCYAPLEEVFASKSRDVAEDLLGPACAGSCALLSFYDSHSRLLRVALAGDSRAVLGRQRVNDEGDIKYDVYVLSTDHNGINQTEVDRLDAEHPGENVCQGGRVLGMGISRAFGDARYKWARDLQDRLKKGYLGKLPLPEVKTPPYLTAEPDVTEIEIQPGDFLIMATDGLWECLTSEEAVGLVGLFKEAQGNRFGTREPVGGYPPDALPVWMAERDHTVRYKQWGAEKRFVMTDVNAATHLLRNALGGADKDLTAALLAMKTPRSRKYRDDMTVLVVFFGEEDGRGLSGRRPKD
ncbi:protein serine/threonine phosphatase 2C [Dichomitus squalens]|uniref:Protein serine/threonine phosphatase 2C n=1 Tax=Dichomitus squalens TaxID=114155 RepID=A0A4Q9MQJ0_9APHY|nr:protein serine/threonine phosphatase 2C [Dichomitus squalens]